jgi:hypothetical protein
MATGKSGATRAPYSQKRREPVTIDAEAKRIDGAAGPETAFDAGAETVAAAGETPATQSAWGRTAEADVESSAPPHAATAGSDATSAPAAATPGAHPVTQNGTLAGGLIGAAVALAAGFGLQWAGLLPTPSSGVSAISDRVGALEQRLASDGASEGEAVAALSAELAALKESVAALTQAAGDTSIADRVTALEQQAASVDPAAVSTGDVSALAARIAALESGGGDTAERWQALETEIAALGEAMAQVRDQAAASNSEPGLAAAVAATALRAAIDRGGAFAGELETLAALAPGSEAVEALRAYAAAGVPTRIALIAEFEDAAQAMLTAAAPADPDASLLDRLLESARGLVKVRPVGEVAGDGADARIARMGEALKRQDDAAFLAEFEALPAASRAAGEAFIERFRARMEADRLITQAVGAASQRASGG